MSVFYYEPFYDFDRLLDEAVAPRGGQGQLQRRNQNEGESGAVRPIKPRMDLHEDPEKNQVTATFELPGLKKDDVNIDVHNGRLTVTGESKKEEDKDENGYAVRERRYGKFSRTLQLPEGVKEDQIKANMDNGVLKVTFPKSSPEAAPKKINIS
ncbi:HSP20-like chaperone [Lyophyllum atratum]|nr:HSP20-like chaperone [Lyophyllum atratum]